MSPSHTPIDLRLIGKILSQALDGAPNPTCSARLIASRTALFATVIFALLATSVANAQGSGPGQALSFNVSRQSYVQIQNDPELNPYPMTVTAWVKTSQATGGAGLVNKYLSGAFNGWQISLYNGDVRVFYFADAANYIWDGGDGLSGGFIADGNWHYVALTVDATGGNLYVDGTLKSSLGWTGTPAAPTSRQPLMLGYYPGTGPKMLTGELDEITLWNRSLSSDEILANMHQSPASSSPGLVLYLRLDDGPGDMVFDSTGHGHDGLLINSPYWITSTAPIADPVATLSQEPMNRVAEAGTSVSFSIATPDLPATYQWRKDGQTIAGQTKSTLVLPSVSPNDEGMYDAVVTNTAGTVTSLPAELKVITKPEILTQPVGDIANIGSSETFAVRTAGGRPLTHHWFHDGTLLSSSTSASLTLSNLKLSDAGNYQLVVSNAYGAVTSSIAILKVHSGAITNNLVLHMAFDSTLADSSGHDNHGLFLHNGTSEFISPTYAAGRIGQSFEYTTTDNGSRLDYASLGYPPDLRLGRGDFSISMWVNYTNQDSDIPILSNKDWDKSHHPGWAISTQSQGTFRVNFTGPNEGEDMFSTAMTPVVRDGTWHHIVVSVLRVSPPLAGYVSTFLDGTLVDKSPMSLGGTIDTFSLPFTYASPAPTDQTGWAVNIGQDGTGVYYSGHNIGAKIDDLGIWRRALTAEEAKGIYDAGLEDRDLTFASEKSDLQIAFYSESAVLTWTGSPLIKLQMSPTLNRPIWSDVPETLGQSFIAIPLGDAGAFFRLVRLP
ncbi:hypothetical protein GC207_03435 [bacterium]|nr:hypothetical protein [bacterium]